MAKIEIGDWVTSYYTGIWQVVGEHPVYEPMDYTTSSGKQRRKGDPAGSIFVLKQGFNGKFQFRAGGCRTCHTTLCRKVTKTELKKIEKHFADHPKDAQKFDAVPAEVPPTVASFYLHLDDEQFRTFDLGLETPFSLPQVRARLAELGIEEQPLGSKQIDTLLYVYCHPWEVDANFDSVALRCELKRLKND